MTAPIQVRAWLDVACPWCWVAKRRFEAAVAEFGGEVAVVYHSFELAPELPADYVSSEAGFLLSHYRGSQEPVEQRMRLVASTAARLGLAYDFGAVQHTSTFLAHQLLHYAKANGRQLQMLDVLFSAFFEKGRNLSRVDELVTLATEVGLDPAKVRPALAEGRYADAVRADRALARTLGVANIPTYIIEGQSPIHGAKRPAVLSAALRRAAEVGAAGTPH